MEQKQISIPDELVQVCRDMAKVAREHGLLQFSGKFSPRHTWGGDISFSWEAGRHGEDADEIKVTSQFFVHTKVSSSSNSR